MTTLRSLGLLKFAGAMMYVMREVFGMGRDLMLCEPNEKHGAFLLNEILLAGNMEHYDERLKKADNGTRLKRFITLTRYNFRLLKNYPSETLWSPFTRIKVWAWRKKNGWI